MTDGKDLRTVISLCTAALAMNLVGAFIAAKFNLPLFLDTSGTVFIAALGGYLPGIAVGFFTNLIKSFVDPAQMYFCSVSVAVAIITTFLARKGLFQNFFKALAAIPMLTVVTSTCDFLIKVFLKVTDVLEPIKEFGMDFTENFAYELLDKGFAVLVAFVLIKLVSPQTKNFFRFLGRKQAPLSDEMKRISAERKYLSSSLRTKMLVILTLSSLLLSFSVALISYLLFKDFARDDRIKTVDGLVAVMVSEINPDRVDDYIYYGRDDDKYQEIEEKFYALKNSNSDIKYLYVYRFSKRGVQVVFDLNTSAMEGDQAGDFVEIDESARPYLDDFIAGRPVPPIIADDNFGYLLTLYKPVYDVNGKCQCYAAIDFSMNILNEYTRTFTIKLFALFLGCFVFVFAIGLVFIENNVILPVNTMAYCAENFSYDSEESRNKNFKRLKNLRINTGDEIENLYAALIRTTKNIFRYLEHLQRAKSVVADMQVRVSAMDEIAYKDSLTGVKNKASYDREIAALNKKILSARAHFCIVMIDVNFLKRVNDTYGHERGNEYLINACRFICAIFGAENVYRIGGDEFVVIIEGEKVSLVKYFRSQFAFEMERKNADETLQPWEKISAAIGVANYEPVHDKTAEEVFKRADVLMYENKLAMKANRRD